MPFVKVPVPEKIPAKPLAGKLTVIRSFRVEPGDKTILTLDFQSDEFVVIAGDRGQVKPLVTVNVTQGDRPLIIPVSSPLPGQGHAWVGAD